MSQAAQFDGGRELEMITQQEPLLGNLLKRFVSALNRLSSNIGAGAMGEYPAPAPVDSTTVKGAYDSTKNTLTVTGETLHWVHTHNAPLNRGIQYVTEIDTNPAFPYPHPIDSGSSRSGFIQLPTYQDDGKTLNGYYLRVTPQYHGSAPATPTVFGGSASPTKIVMSGSTSMTLLTSQAGGTARPGQGGKGIGPIQSRPAIKTSIATTNPGGGTPPVTPAAMYSGNWRAWKASAAVGASLNAGFGCTPAEINVSSNNYLAPTASAPLMVDLRQGGGSPLVVSWDSSTNSSVTYGNVQKLKMLLQIPTIQTTGTWRNWYGWSSVNSAGLQVNDPSTANVVMFRYVRGTDTNWQAYTANSSASTVTDTGVALDNKLHTFEIDTTGSSAKFYIDGSLVATVTTTLPATSAGLMPITQQEWSGGIYDLYVGAIYWELNVGF